MEKTAFLADCSWYPLYGSLGVFQSRSGRCREEKPFLFLTNIEHRFLGRPARSPLSYRVSYPGSCNIKVGQWICSSMNILFPGELRFLSGISRPSDLTLVQKSTQSPVLEPSHLSPGSSWIHQYGKIYICIASTHDRTPAVSEWHSSLSILCPPPGTRTPLVKVWSVS
jgi:hypothetical protein